MTQPNDKQPRNWGAVKNWVIATLVTILFSLIAGAVGFYNGVHYAESKQHQADTQAQARVEQAVAALKAEASK